MMAKSKGILRIIVLAAISVIIGTKLYSWNAESLVGNKLPMPFGYGCSVVMSGSMEPELSVNDFVIIKQDDSYEPDDIVVYQQGHSLVIHRLISINGETAVTKGDANDIPDPEIRVKDIKGRMTAHIPYLGAAVRFVKSSVGTVLLLLAAIIMFEMPYLKDRRKAVSEQEKIKEEIRRLKNKQSMKG